ncbi:MAG: rolling circle replication-associated protein [Caldisericum sp.]|uniref:rolling circle replication-associated protein n=1 Tax=Caldisericum sp. TaxID=2499687 RepID=UPI003D150992
MAANNTIDYKVNKFNDNPIINSVERNNGKKRKRNEWYRKAQFFVELDYEDWKDAFVNGVEYICEFAKNYVLETKDKRIILINRDLKKALVLSYTHRFHEYYVRKVRRKFIEISKDLYDLFHGKLYANFITLTINPNEFSSLKDVRVRIMKSFNSFHTAMKRYLDDDYYGFLRIVEIGREHNLIHIHVIYFTTRKFISVEKLRKLWKLGNVDIRYFDSVGESISYAIKYVRKFLKEIQDNDSIAFHYFALMWALNMRVYSYFIAFSQKEEVSLDYTRLIQTKFEFVVPFWLNIYDLRYDPACGMCSFLGLGPPKIHWEYIGCFELSLEVGVYSLDEVMKILNV